MKAPIFLIPLPLFVSCFTVRTHKFQEHSPPELDGIGISSVLPIPNNFQNQFQLDIGERVELYVGTKRGQLFHVSVPKIFDENSIEINVTYINTSNGVDNIILKPYPVYSMSLVRKASSSVGFDVLSGGGDRYVTVWEANFNSSENTKLRVKQQLGPHTGWVKDLSVSYSLSNEANLCDCTVFSIGCNCVEVWLLAQNEYAHQCKLQIESSVDMGCTLSSDLLCLATYKCNQSSRSYLLAGGVDGRLHRWIIPQSINELKKSTEFCNTGVVLAHNGRVNSMLVCSKFGALVTTGADGCITCKTFSSKSFHEWEVASINMNGRLPFETPSFLSESKINLSASCVVRDGLSTAVISVGSSSGHLFLIQLSRTDSSEVELKVLQQCFVHDDHEGHNIHALCSFEDKEITESSSNLIAVGHSNGLLLCSFS